MSSINIAIGVAWPDITMEEKSRDFLTMILCVANEYRQNDSIFVYFWVCAAVLSLSLLYYSVKKLRSQNVKINVYKSVILSVSCAWRA
jgi:hypothetical protein